MIEALWGVEFLTSTDGAEYDGGYSVAVFETERVLGGDSSSVYVGTIYEYDPKTDTVRAKVRCTNDRGLLESIFGGLREFTVAIEGKPARDQFDMFGHMIEDPSWRIALRLTRRAELP